MISTARRISALRSCQRDRVAWRYGLGLGKVRILAPGGRNGMLNEVVEDGNLIVEGLDAGVHEIIGAGGAVLQGSDRLLEIQQLGLQGFHGFRRRPGRRLDHMFTSDRKSVV